MLKVLFGAVCGGLLSAGLLLGPFKSSAVSVRLPLTTQVTAACNAQMQPILRAESTTAETQLLELQRLLDSVRDTKRNNPATQAQIQRLLSTLVLDAPIETAQLFVESGSLQELRLFRQFLKLWVANDGVELIHTLPLAWREDQPRLYREIFQMLANTLPKQTLPHILALPPSNLRPGLMLNIAYAFDMEDMPAFFLSLSELTVREQQLFLEWDPTQLANKAPHQLLDWSRTLNQPLRRLAELSALRSLARTDPKSALTIMDGQQIEGQSRVVRLALRQLAESEPELAAAEAEIRGGFFSDVALTWAVSNPHAASQWFIKHTPDARRSSHDPLMSIATKWARQDIDAAVAFASTLPEELRSAWTNAIASQLGHSDPDRLEALAHSLSETPYAAEMFTQLALQRYNTNPEAALNQVLSLKPALRNRPLSMLARHTMEHTPKKALSVVDQISDQETRMDTLGWVLRRWQNDDDAAMEQWITGQASPALRDEAYATLAVSQPKYLTSIKDRKLRIATFLRIQNPRGSTPEMGKLLEQLELSEAQWDQLYRTTTASP